MANVEKQRQRLISLLKALFQLDQPDLDFGFYRIMHSKAGQVTKFLEEDLLSIIREAFGEVDETHIATARAAYETARKQAADYGAPDPDATEPVKKAKDAYDAAKNSGSNEGDVYDHLYRFFERYYDTGDFLSRRYYARETDGKAAPYAVPYDGREVYLHWANRDQYYIKTTEYLSNFTFDAAQAPEFQQYHGGLLEGRPLKVHCRIVTASEGEHNNVKASEQTERYFIIHDPEPVKLEISETGAPELVIQFQYRADPEKTGQEGTWRKKRLSEASEKVKRRLATLDGAEDYVTALMTPAPTEAEKTRTLLEKYLAQYAARNTMDYFIHKDLGGFLRRELDFYIKNEVMRLDDIESADAPGVEAYLSKIKVLRAIARHLIDFVAQLEEFQKKLWLKKKFVVDTSYCITLDRIPESFYPEITRSDSQRQEWVRLFAIDQLDGYSAPLTTAFLKKNQMLSLDSALFPEEFTERILSVQENIDSNLAGICIHSDNFQALRQLAGL
jgi:adenine-specific DNA-methyltransferase